MRTSISKGVLATTAGARANEIIRSCVHCGFCNATCPTYQVLGNELDGPRGRIYLMKEMLESGHVDDVVETHLGRCLTCRACETTCPSGVQYGELVEIGREIVQHERPSRSLVRRFVTAVVPRRDLFEPLIAIGRFFAFLAPARFKRLVKKPPACEPVVGEGEVVLLQGCVQRAVTPEVNAHLARLLAKRGIETRVVDDEACCGGLPLHLGDVADARALARKNVAAMNDERVARIVSTASGCGVTWKDYGRLLGSADAQAVAAKVVDAAELLADFEFERRLDVRRVAWHPPCSLQHGQAVTGVVERILERAGYELVPVADAHLCCGSAGSYALLQPAIADELKQRKVSALGRNDPEVVATANIGCQTHLADGMGVPVHHWLELLE